MLDTSTCRRSRRPAHSFLITLRTPTLFASAALLLCQCATPNFRKVSPDTLARVGEDPQTIRDEIEERRTEATRLESEAAIARSEATDTRNWIAGNSGAEFTVLTEKPADVRVKRILQDLRLPVEDGVKTADAETAVEELDSTEAQKTAAAGRVKAEAGRLERIEQEVSDIRKDGITTVSSDQLFFSFVPLIAFRGGLEATAIPAVAVNVQPFDLEGNHWLDPLGLQAIFGGVLNPQDSDGGPNAAVGAGLWYPIGDAGSLGVGYVIWDDDSETRSGLYIGLSLGQSRTKVPAK